MVGKNNSVLSQVRGKKDHQVFNLDCVSHFANMCAVAMVKCLHEPVEDLLIDTFFWFDKRLALGAFYDMCDMNYEKYIFQYSD